MKQQKSILLDAISWMQKVDAGLSPVWPPELPPEEDPSMWPKAARLEMENRAVMTAKIEQLIEGSLNPETLSPLDQWFYRRRVEWGAQLLLATAQRGFNPKATLAEILRWALIASWDRDGCIGFWNHAIERGGKPHPENPDGFSPLPSS